jgi:hypothetical protein
MGSWTDNRGRRLVAAAAAMLVLLIAMKWYYHVHINPIAMSTLLFELLKVPLLIGCTIACTFMILLVRAREMAAATAAMLALLLAGGVYFGGKPATPSAVLFELIEVLLLVGTSLVCVFLLRRRWAEAAAFRPFVPPGKVPCAHPEAPDE